MGMIKCDIHGLSFLALVNPHSLSTYKKQEVLNPNDWVFLEIPGGGLPTTTLKSEIFEKSDQKKFVFLASISGETVPVCAKCFEEKMGGKEKVKQVNRIEVKYGLGEKEDLEYFFDLIEGKAR